MKLPRIWMSPIWKRLPVLSESAAWMPCAQSRTTLSRICTLRAMTPPTTMPWFPKRGPVSPIGAPRRTRLSATLSSATSTTSTPICVEPTSNWFPVMRTTSEDASALGRTVRHERVREAASRQPIVQPVTFTSTQPSNMRAPSSFCGLCCGLPPSRRRSRTATSKQFSKCSAVSMPSPRRTVEGPAPCTTTRVRLETFSVLRTSNVPAWKTARRRRPAAS